VNETSFVKYYLLKSLRRRIIKAIEKKKHSNGGKESRIALIFNTEDDFENKVLLQENLSDLTHRMRKVLANLTARQQEVIYFRFYLDADIEEIAEIMEISRQSVYNLLHSSLKKLKQLSSKGAFSLSRFFTALPPFM
jgi:RNA polymerase sigma factor (sigma-70 family)